jgi:hypothetical protein
MQVITYRQRCTSVLARNGLLRQSCSPHHQPICSLHTGDKTVFVRSETGLLFCMGTTRLVYSVIHPKVYTVQWLSRVSEHLQSHCLTLHAV